MCVRVCVCVRACVCGYVLLDLSPVYVLVHVLFCITHVSTCTRIIMYTVHV